MTHMFHRKNYPISDVLRCIVVVFFILQTLLCNYVLSEITKSILFLCSGAEKVFRSRSEEDRKEATAAFGRGVRREDNN